METNETAVAVVPSQSVTLSLKQIADRVNIVHQVLEKVLKKGTHYGTVPGCGDKMVLLKPGADVLAMTFRLAPQFAIERRDIGDGHVEYSVTCTMYGPDGAQLGQGVGSASTMEKKYRYRKDSKGNKIENEDIADVYNTVLKIAKKRAHIDATLTVTGSADLFTQDLIDDDEPSKPMPTTPKAAPASAKPVEPDGKTSGQGISEAQGKRLFAIASYGCGIDALRAHLKETYGIEHSRDVTKADYESICRWAEGQREPGSEG